MISKYNLRNKVPLVVKFTLLVSISVIFNACEQKKASPFEVPEPTKSSTVSVVTSFESPPNVLLVTIDTCRSDRIGCYDFAFAQTQALDKLAQEGVRCDNAIAATPVTMPSHSTIHTGLLPPAHGVRENGVYSLSDDAETLAERLKDSGYSTHAIVSAEVLNRRYNLSQGFDEYVDDLWEEDTPETFMIRDRAAQKTAKKTIDMLDRWNAQPEQDAKPFFMWMHLFDPHQPWQADIPNRAMLPTPYDAEIAQADDGIEAVIHWLRTKNILDNTLVIVTADHGESLGEHGEDTHSIFIYDATVKIPMVWRFPGKLPAGISTDAPVHQADIVPTILSLLDLPGGEETQGRDLSALLRDEVKIKAYPQYSESKVSEGGFGMAPLYAVRYDGYKYIEAPRPELYDLSADPKELKNIIADDPKRTAKLKAMLATIIAESEARALSSSANPMDETTLEMLEALGYLSAEDERAAMDGIDPKDGIELHALLKDARYDVQVGKWKKAEKTLRELIDRSPGHISAMNILGMVLWRQGRMDEAELAFQDSLRVQPSQYRALFSLGHLKLLLDEADEAIQLFEQAISLQPRFVEPMVYLANTVEQQGDNALAQQWYARALAEAPESPGVNMTIASLYFTQERYEAAIPYYVAALAINEKSFGALSEAGLCYLRLRKLDEAIPFFEKAAVLRPERWESPYDLACIYALKDNTADAIETLLTMLDAQKPGMQQRLILRIKKDKDLKSLQDLPEFDAFLKQYEAKPKE